MSQHSSAPNTQVPSKQPAVADRKRDGVSTAQLSSTGSGCGKETSSKWHNCLSKCRKLATKSEDATASTSNHDPLKNPLHEQNSKQSIEQSPQPSHTGNNVPLGHSSVTPHTAAAVAMTTEVTGVDLSKEGSAEVTPESLRVTCTLGSGSATKRRLKLEEGVSCRPGTKRRRTSTRDSSKKQPVAKVDSSPLEVKKSVQMTMQSFFRPS